MTFAEEVRLAKEEGWTRICGHEIRGNFISFPCIDEPGHEGEHIFAAFHAEYRVGRESGYAYMRSQ